MKQFLVIGLIILLVSLLVGCNNKGEIKMEKIANKEKAVNVLTSLESGNKEQIEKWINPNKYIQHNLGFPNGRKYC